MMILWMIFGESQVKRIAFATTPAKNIAENKKNLMTIPEYIKTIDTLNKTLDSETFIKF